MSATSWTWAFGDGSAANTRNPSHSYQGNGAFLVQLIAENICGRDTIEKTVYTGFAPEADATAKQDRMSASECDLDR
ncbi:MAG: PKD domain-containing protein [Saprospiraceae bacterium]